MLFEFPWYYYYPAAEAATTTTDAEEREIANLEAFLDKVMEGKGIDTTDDLVGSDQLIVDRVKKEYTLLHKYEAQIEKSLSRNSGRLIRYIGMYRDRNSNILSSPYPTDYPKFWTKDQNIIFEVTGINQEEMEEDINKVTIPDGAKKKRYITAFPVLMLLIMRYYLKTKQKEKFSACIYYLGYSNYWMAYTISFKKFLPRQEAVVYAVNNLSNRFFLKQLGSIDNLIYYATLKTIACYRERLLRASDWELFYITDGVRTRIGNYEKKVAMAIYDAVEKKQVIFEGDDQFEDGDTRLSESVSSKIEAYAQQYTDKFFGEAPNRAIIARAAKSQSIAESELRSTITLLIDNQLEEAVNEVRDFYRAIFYLYFTYPGVESRKYFDRKLFLGIMEGVYKRGNVKDENIMRIKDLMNKWLEQGSATYRATNRLATMNSLRKAIFYYFILLVAINPVN